MIVNDLSFLIGGEAGSGITRSGSILAKACMRGGLNVFCMNDYQSLIRGGHNYYLARVASKEIQSQTEDVNLLVALNAEAAILHKDELTAEGGIIYDPDDVTNGTRTLDAEKLRLFPIPLRRIVVDELKQPHNLIMRNTVALGAAVAVLGYELAMLEEILKDTFKPEIAELNTRAARIGSEYAKRDFDDSFAFRLEKMEKAGKRRIFLSGNEAVGLGAIRAGCRFYSAYPMTPTTGVLHFMAANERDYGLVVLQPEGEIAAINMAIGAAFAGARAMTATSGGGFCLMSEGLGMAGMTETPVVVMVGQRPGPSTGLPTYSSQGDLLFALHAGQGEFPKVVLAPGDIEECFYETMRAFNLAEKYQLPVILLTDKYLAESEKSAEPFNADLIRIERGILISEKPGDDKEYERYEITETGVSPRAVPSVKQMIVRANSDEHDERGFTCEDPIVTTMMTDKRMRKMSAIVREFEEKNVETTKLHGPQEAQATVISWGSTKGPILEAMETLNQERAAVNFLQIICLHPFPKARVKRALEKARKTVVVECNKTSQLSSLIKEHALSKVDHKILKYDGRPFDPGSLVEKIKEIL